jgi:predicted double-glycine peptidase
MKRHLFAGIVYVVAFSCFSAQSGESLSSFRELRYEVVVGQTNEYTCGAATVATILTYFYGISTSESEILNLAEESMQMRGEEPSQGHGLTAYDLKKGLEAEGIEAKGFQVTPQALQDYFIRGGLPVIIHLTKPEKHFVVAVGMAGNQIVLADSSWGRSIIPFTVLISARGYSEVVLVPIPSPELAIRAEIEQKKTLVWAQDRLIALAWLREDLP